ncbi:conserved hypothetical protein [Pediculus humanus corporis]|uniref:LON peptidase N-terminal domain and RING finger protein n=1 Tax=Pediculus humanus subsp. corporis TaxID=121224 RepID=E0VT37_PEDHC|nr:uncharacterized protein Phum_PHUM426280 [Pediculus humanus corporis]EEB16543.1 conserved hypothetical protein [Pediculus humanus corporis]
MSLVSDMTKDSFMHRNNYIRVGDYYEKTFLKGKNVYANYGDTLSKCGKVLETLDLYDSFNTVGEISSEKLKHVTYGLIESIMATFNHFPGKNFGVTGTNASSSSYFVCGICESVLRHPVTLSCGHTFCRRCLIKDSSSRTCRKCCQKINSPFETNVLVKQLVEKFWSKEIIGAEIRDEGNDHLQRNEFDDAVSKYNEALGIVPSDHLTLCARSHAFYRMGRYQASLADAEHVIRIRPHWGKGYHRKGVAMLAMGMLEEALTSLCIFVALEKNPQVVRHDICKEVRLKVEKIEEILHGLLCGSNSYNNINNNHNNHNNFSSRHLNRSFATTNHHHHQINYRRGRYYYYYHHSPMVINSGSSSSSSDCEDHSSGSSDEDVYEFPDCLSLLIKKNFHDLINHVFNEIDKIKRTNVVKSIDLSLEPSLIDKSDFDCVLCCRTLWKPITTSCGHTYCLSCLERSLDYSTACPLCMKNLSDHVSVSSKSVSEFLSKFLKMYLPSEYLTRQITHQSEISKMMVSCHDKESYIPVFVCTTAYPTIHCPLFIYEPRYRLMIRQCVEAGTRRFGIAACFTSENGSRRFADFGTILEIKDWVLMSNGCSILSTVGVRRFRTLSRDERDGYELAKVKLLIDEPITDSCLPTIKQFHDKVREKAISWVKTLSEEFKEKVFTSFGTIPEVEENWRWLPDGPSWTWWLLAILPLGPLLQVSILGTTNLEKRLKAIDKTLSQIQNKTHEYHFNKKGEPNAFFSYQNS